MDPGDSDSNKSDNTSSSSGIHSSSHSNYSDEISLDSDDSDYSTNLRFIAYREQLVDYLMH